MVKMFCSNFLTVYIFSLLISAAFSGHGEAGSHPDTLQRDIVKSVHGQSAATTLLSLVYSLQFEVDYGGKHGRS